MKVLVTGGAGFIGHHLSNILYELGHDVTVWDNLSKGKKERLFCDVKFQHIDIWEDELPEDTFDAVFHLAAPTSVQESLENPKKYEEGCYLMTTKLFEWCTNHGVQFFTFASTASVYGPTDKVPSVETDILDPISPYAEFKLKSEEYLMMVSEDTDIQITITRFFNVFGEEQPDSGSYAPAVAIFLKQYYENNPITVTGDGKQTRDYIYVKDIVYALLWTIKEQEYKIEIFNLGTGKEITVLEIAETFNHPIVHIEQRKEPRRSLSDCTKANKVLQWETQYNIVDWLKMKLR